LALARLWPAPWDVRLEFGLEGLLPLLARQIQWQVQA